MATSNENELANKAVHDDRDVIYMLRTVHQNQMQMNIMADQKANILAGTIAILITLMVTRLPSLSIAADSDVVSSIAIFIVFEIIALSVCIYVLVPKTVNYKRKVSKVSESPNPFFFGFYTEFDESEFVDFMTTDIMNNMQARHYLSKDIYQAGLALKRKYRYLKWAYVLALTGVMFASLNFCVLKMQGISV